MFFKNDNEKRQYIKKHLQKIEKARYLQATLILGYCMFTGFSKKFYYDIELLIIVAIAISILHFYSLSNMYCPICGEPFWPYKYIMWPEKCSKCGENLTW